MKPVHPFTQERLNQQAKVGRQVTAYGEAELMFGRGEATASLPLRKYRELQESIRDLVKAAQAEGALSMELVDGTVEGVLGVKP